MKHKLIYAHKLFIGIFVTWLACLSTTNAQMSNGKYGNEWINPQQSYYKIKVTEDALYRIDAAKLQAAGINLSSLSANNLKLYSLGEEVPIYVHANSGQVDYVEFYGQKNDGTLDKELYRNPNDHFNAAYSLYSDTASYYLSWSSTPNTTSQYTSYATNLVGGGGPEPFFMDSKQAVATSNWNAGASYSLAGQWLSKSTFEGGEGFGTALNKNVTMDVELHDIVTTSNNMSKVQFTCFAKGRYGAHNISVTLNGNSIATYSFSGDSVMQAEVLINTSLLVNGNNTVAVQNTGSNKCALSQVTITYPHQFDFNQKGSYAFQMPASTQDKIIEIDSFDGGSASNQTVYLYNQTTKERIRCFWDGQKVRVRVKAATTAQDLVLIAQHNATAYRNVMQLEEVTFTNLNVKKGDFIIITHPSLRQGHDYVMDYAFFKASKGFAPVVYSINELYDHFAYGVHNHPLAIRNFIHYINNHWTNPTPEHVFLIGKGLCYKQIRDAQPSNHLLPTFGYPVGDILLSAPANSDVPTIPIGRLAATTPDDVRIYLKKIKAYTNYQDNATSFEERNWRKKIMHLAGGSNYYEQCLFESCTDYMKGGVEAGLFGREVINFSTHTNSPVVTPKSEQIDSLFENGCGLISFFGHGTLYDFDYYLKEPTEYHAAPKYPSLMAFACYAGNMFASSEYQSEKYVLAEDAGTINFMSFVHAVEAFSTRDFGKEVYQQMANTNSPRSIGQVLQAAVNQFSNNGNYHYFRQMVAQYMAYHGDPSITLFQETTPDYHTSHNMVEHEVDTKSPSITLDIDIVNLGVNLDTTIQVAIEHIRPNMYKDTTYITVDAPTIRATHLQHKVAVKPLTETGVHNFSVFVDSDNMLDESYNPVGEINNAVNYYTVSFGTAQAVPLYPQEFAIVNDSIITLKASVVNALAENTTYELQFDTTLFFNSPSLQSTQIAASSNIIEWQPSTMPLQDDVVYYWRIRSVGTNSTDWAASSFVYLTGTNGGWNQSHRHQFVNNSTDDIRVDEVSYPTLNFASSIKEFTLMNTIPSASGIHSDKIAMYINGNRSDKCRCNNENGVYVTVIDPTTLEPWSITNNTLYGGRNCDAANRETRWLFYDMDLLASQTALTNLLKDSIPDGHYVILHTLNDAKAISWKTDLVQFLQNQGASKVNQLVSTSTALPYSFFFQKGNPAYANAQEVLADSAAQLIKLSATIQDSWDEGKLYSPIIGPAKNWQSIEWGDTTLESGTSDFSFLRVWGIDKKGDKTMLIYQTGLPNLNISHFDANKYPYLQLEFFTGDDMHRTPNQIKYWRVLGDMMYDLALKVNQNITHQYDTIATGQTIQVDLDVTNLGNITADSAMVYLNIEGTTIQQSQLVTNIQTNDSIPVSFNLPTTNLQGDYRLTVEVRSPDSIAELSELNNIGWLSTHIVPSKSSALVNTTTEERTSTVSTYPNPFSEQVFFKLSMTEELETDELFIDIFSANGQHIRTLNVNNVFQKKLVQTSWDGTNAQGSRVLGGVYYYRTRTSDNKLKQAGKVVYVQP